MSDVQQGLRRKAILIAGPTASGKSSLALALAERLGGVVINTDSMQVYRELRILTARPTQEDERRAPHALYGFVSAADAYSVGRYVADAARALDDAYAKGLVPIFVGGTGLYFKALLEGLSPVPAVEEAVRGRWREAADKLPPGELHRVLAERDADMAERLDPSDLQRIVRALEVIESTGRSLAEWQSESGVPVLAAGDTFRLMLMPDREVLRARVDARFDAMMDAGALDEARALADLGLDTTLPAMRAIGVAPLIATVRGDMSVDGAVEAAKAESRQYLKRQTTWLRRHMIAWNDVSKQELEISAASAVSFIQS
ncbi:MAG: tRNA (adenosine(37)-N6)-dimethylallyltransferase MiaA [Hyphomicrobium sp.]|nr:MAG: tRNA (adenosine(37)-N6)-dimethylallyltransferase MiaA [Hyphomicrobium sp.]